MRTILNFRFDRCAFAISSAIIILVSLAGIRLSAQQKPMLQANPAKKWVLVVHGSAGNWVEDDRSKAAWRKLKDALEQGCQFSCDDRGVLVCEPK